MRIPGLGDGATPDTSPDRALRWHHPAVAHHLPGMAKTQEVPRLHRHRRRRDQLESLERLQRVHQGTQRVVFHRRLDGVGEAVHPFGCVIQSPQVLGEEHLVFGAVEVQAVQPLPVFGRPGPHRHQRWGHHGCRCSPYPHGPAS